jgi:hypothetical protein
MVVAQVAVLVVVFGVVVTAFLDKAAAGIADITVVVIKTSEAEEAEHLPLLGLIHGLVVQD